MHKIYQDKQKRKEGHELLMEMVRTSLSYYYNWNRGKENPQLSPQDFWPLSYDDTRPSEEDKKELQEHTIRRLERIAKKRKQRG